LGGFKEWQIPFDFANNWPEAAQAPFAAFHQARQALQKRMDDAIAANADQEILYDQPLIDKNKLRVTGPFTVEAVPFPSVLSLQKAREPTEATTAVARSGASSRQQQWQDELLKAGIRGKNRQKIEFAEIETLSGTQYLHARAITKDEGEQVVISFGPEHAPLEQRQVEFALRETEKLRPAPKMIVFAAFNFDPEAAKDIDELNWPGVTLLKVQMNTDLLTEDLKKKRASNESFWLMGQPDVRLSKREDGLYSIEVFGFDYFDTQKSDIVSGGKNKIAMWLLDTDYDERALLPRQVFLPMAGSKDGWNKLAKNLKATLNEDRLAAYHGTVSLPFAAGKNRKVAVKLIDDRGIESLKILPLA
jgi:adenine-specific DNA-methyltransferase